MTDNTVPKGRQLNWLTWLIAAAFGISLIVLGVLVFGAVRDYVANILGGGIEEVTGRFEPLPTDTPDLEVTFEPETPVPTLAPLTPPAETLPPQPVETEDIYATPQPWNGRSRITVLILGLDERYWKREWRGYRSDAMMLITYDPVSRQAGMLSIPRDLWVEIPGIGHNRINAAHYFGDIYKLPGGGGALAVKTVEKLLGVPIDYYISFNFAAFERMIDEVGGVDIDVKTEVQIKPYGREKRLVEVGLHHFDGTDALAYARARKGSSDFARTRRQREVVLAILDRVTSLNLLPGLVARAPSLYEELSDSIRTDMGLDDMISLAWLAVKVPSENIRNGVIGAKMVRYRRSPEGWSVLMQVPDKIREVRDEIFVDTSAFGPLVTPSNP